MRFNAVCWKVVLHGILLMFGLLLCIVVKIIDKMDSIAARVVPCRLQWSFHAMSKECCVDWGSYFLFAVLSCRVAMLIHGQNFELRPAFVGCLAPDKHSAGDKRSMCKQNIAASFAAMWCACLIINAMCSYY